MSRLIKERKIFYRKPMLVRLYDKHFLKVLAISFGLLIFARVLHAWRIVI